MRGGPTSVSLFQTLCRTLCRNYPSSSLDLGVEGIAGRDRGKCWQGNAPQDQRHGGWILNTERQSGRQSEDKVRKLLDSSRQDVQTPGPGPLTRRVFDAEVIWDWQFVAITTTL